MTTSECTAAGAAHLPLETFASLIRVARLLGEIVPLSELIRRHRDGRDTAGLVAVTLDDAYAALGGPFRDFIAREQVPIAVFAVTRAAASGATYWWDRVDDAFPNVPPPRWRDFEAACGVPEAYRQGQPREHGPLRPLRQWMLAAYAGRWPEHLDLALHALEAAAGVRTHQRSMTFDELDALVATGLAEVGVHTASHPVLPLVPDADLREEIASSYEVLSARFSAAIPVLAIPFGLYDERTLRIARASGMSACLTLEGRSLGERAAWDALPRFCVTSNDTPARLGLRLLELPHAIGRWSVRQMVSYPDLPSPTT